VGTGSRYQPSDKLLKTLPADARLGDNANAFIGGFRLWEQDVTPPRSTPPRKTR